jgi:hypothetical protein
MCIVSSSVCSLCALLKSCLVSIDFDSRLMGSTGRFHHVSSPARIALLDVLASFYLHAASPHSPGASASHAFLTGLRRFCCTPKEAVIVDTVLAQLEAMQGSINDSHSKLVLDASTEITRHRGHSLGPRVTMTALLKYREVTTPLSQPPKSSL